MKRGLGDDGSADVEELLRRIPRRTLLAGLGAGLAGLVLAACSGPDTAAATRGRRARTARVEPTTTLPPPPTTLAVPVTPAAQVATSPIFYVDQFDPQTPPNSVALTIDDGPSMPYTEQILGVLSQNGIKATFCQIGSQVRSYPTLAREVVAEGHAVCNHSYTHPQPFATMDPMDISTQILGGLEAIHEVTGATPNTFRSPGGDWSDVVFEQLAEVGQAPIDWSDDTTDWTQPGTATITSRLLAARPHDIVLCHDGGGPRSETVVALKAALPVLKARGLTFVTL